VAGAAPMDENEKKEVAEAEKADTLAQNEEIEAAKKLEIEDFEEEGEQIYFKENAEEAEVDPITSNELPAN
jgi:hypothetical protein